MSFIAPHRQPPELAELPMMARLRLSKPGESTSTSLIRLQCISNSHTIAVGITMSHAGCHSVPEAWWIPAYTHGLSIVPSPHCNCNEDGGGLGDTAALALCRS